MATHTLSILKPSVNNLTARVLVRAAGLDFEEQDVWGKTTTPEYLEKYPAHLTPMLEAEGLPRGTLKIKMLNERAEYALQQEAIMWVLRENLIGPNVGRWDYLNSREEMFRHDPAEEKVAVGDRQRAAAAIAGGTRIGAGARVQRPEHLGRDDPLEDQVLDLLPEVRADERRLGHWHAVSPPSSVRTWPVMKADCGEARKRAAPTMSSGVAGRGPGALTTTSSSDSSPRPPVRP